MAVVSGIGLESLQTALLEHFNPGERVQVLLRLHEPLSDLQFHQIQQTLLQHGLDAKIEAGSTDRWPNALRLVFTRPSIKHGQIGFIPLLGIVALGGLGLFGLWQLNKLTTALTKNLVPLALIAAAAVIAVTVLKEPQHGKR